MKLIESHRIYKSNPYYEELDLVCFHSKNIYNSCLYIWRQSFIPDDVKTLTKKEVYQLIKEEDCYKELPQSVSVEVFNQCMRDVDSFFKALKSYKKNPKQFTGRPKLPKYKDKENGRNLAIYNKYVIPKVKSKNCGKLCFTKLKTQINSKIEPDNVKQVRITRNNDYYQIDVVYETPYPQIKTKGVFASIDLGVSNLATVSFSDGRDPIVINGRPLKSINQFYNKNLAKLKSSLEKRNNKKTSKRIKNLTRRRNDKIKDYIHKATRVLVNHLDSRGVHILIIGKNDNWKQEVNIGKRNNQNFAGLPFEMFINQMDYKCEQVGISVTKVNESYTSKCSFLDGDAVQKNDKYGGYREKRGMYRSYKFGKINADLNGSYNILRKVVPNFISKLKNGIEGVVRHPRVITL